MAILEIPTTSELDRYSQIVSIDDVDYRMLFAYNTRMERWSLSVYLTDGTELATGIPLLSNQPLLARWSGVGDLPRDGTLMLVDATGEGVEPAKETLGDTHRLLWIPDEGL